MSGSSGGGGNTTTTTSQPPASVLANYNSLTGAAGTLASQNPLSLYSSPMVAGFSPAQQAGFSEVANSQGIGVPYLNSAAAEFGQATTPLYNTVQNYESPYTRDVTNSLTQLFDQQNAQQQAQIQGNATSHGAYGGDREAVAQALAAQQENLAQAPTLAQTLQQGYSTGLSADEAQSWLASQAGFGIGALGPQAQSEALTGANALMGIGSQQQQLAQEQMNIPYQQFQATQAYPYQNLGFLAPIVEGTGSLSGGQGSTTTPGPTALSQIGGLASAGAGLAGLFTGNNSNSGSGLGSGFGSTDLSGTQDFGSAFAKDGGRIGFAGGGGIGMPGSMNIPTGVPNVDLSYIPEGTPNPSAVGGMLSPMQPDVTKTETTAPSGGGGIGLGDILGAGKFIAGLFAHGGRIGYDDGGTVDPNKQRGGIGLPPVPQISLDQIIKPGPEIKGAGPPKAPSPGAAAASPLGDISGLVKSGKSLFGNDASSSTPDSSTPSESRGGGIGHYDAGGVPVQVAAQFGGANPSQQNQMASLQGLPIEKLQEMAVQYPPNTPQGQLVAMALKQKQANPGAQQAPQQQQQGGIGTQPSSAGTSQSMPDTGSYGGTSHAEGGSVGDGLGYVTEDELDPHPVVDHSGDTVKIHYPSEGKVLDLGLPSIGGRKALAAGGSSGQTAAAAPVSPSFQIQQYTGNTRDAFAQGATQIQQQDGTNLLTFPDGSTFYLGQPGPLYAAALNPQPAAAPAAAPPPPPTPAPAPAPPQLPPTAPVPTTSSFTAGNGVQIPQLNPDAFSIRNLMNDPFTGQPYQPGAGNGNYFNPLQQWQPPGTNLPTGNSNGFPAFQPNVAGMGLISGQLAGIGQNTGNTASSQGKRGGNVAHFDGGGDVTDTGGFDTVAPPASYATGIGGDVVPTSLPSVDVGFGGTYDYPKKGPSVTGGKDIGQAVSDLVSDTVKEHGASTGPAHTRESPFTPMPALDDMSLEQRNDLLKNPRPSPASPRSALPLSPMNIGDDGSQPTSAAPPPPAPAATTGQTVSVPAKGIGASVPAGQIGIGATTVADSDAYAPDDSGTYQPPGAPPPIIRASSSTAPGSPVPHGTAPQDVYAVGDSHAGGLIRYGGLKGTMGADPSAVNADAANSRSPKQVYDYIASRPADYWKGKSVTLSTGVSNDPSQVDLVPWQIQALKDRGANVVGVAGFGPKGAAGTDMRPVADKVAAYAAEKGVPSGGVFQSNLAQDNVHLNPQGYQQVGGWYKNNGQAPGPGSATEPQQQGTPITRMVDQLIPVSDDPGQRKAALGFKALLPLETAQNPEAVSPAGAIGIAQIIPSTGRELGLGTDDLRDPQKALPAGLKYFTDRLNDGGGDLKAAWIGYNAGPQWEQKWLAAGRNDAILPQETQNYLVGAQANYDKLNGGTQLADIWSGHTGNAPGRTGIGHQPDDVINDNPPQHDLATGIGTDPGTRQGIGLVQQAIERRGDLGDQQQQQHHGLSLHDMALPLLIAGLTTLASRSPNALAEGFRAAAPYFTAAERQEAAQQVAEARQGANATTNQYKLDALSQKALADKQRADDAAARLKETTQHHTDTLTQQQATADALSKYRQTQLELAAARVETGQYAPPTYGEGDDPDHPGQKTHGMWYAPKNPNSGNQPMFIPGVGSPKPQTGEAGIYQGLVDQKIAKNIPDAARIMADAKRDPKTFQESAEFAKMVGAEKANNPGASEAQARQNVVRRLQTPLPQVPGAAPAATQQQTAAPAQPAPAAAPRPTQTAPAQQPAQAAPAAPPWGSDPHKVGDKIIYRGEGGQWFNPDHTPYQAPAQPAAP